MAEIQVSQVVLALDDYYDLVTVGTNAHGGMVVRGVKNEKVTSVVGNDLADMLQRLALRTLVLLK